MERLITEMKWLHNDRFTKTEEINTVLLFFSFPIMPNFPFQQAISFTTLDSLQGASGLDHLPYIDVNELGYSGSKAVLDTGCYAGLLCVSCSGNPGLAEPLQFSQQQLRVTSLTSGDFVNGAGTRCLNTRTLASSLLAPALVRWDLSAGCAWLSNKRLVLTNFLLLYWRQRFERWRRI